MSNATKSLILTVVCTLSAPALAQLAPTGDHYAGRPSDTGFGGTSPNAAGTFTATIPFSLPTARGGLPIPLQITYGTRGVGAAGLGWDLPLSYIQHDRTLAHRRPARGTTIPALRDRVYVSLLGQSLDLVPYGGAWVARSGTPQFTARESGGTWVAYDGEGRTYTFIRPPGLSGTGLWLLKSITTAGAASLQLTYQITTWPLDGGVGSEVNLVRVTYNGSPAAGCAKTEIALTYGYGSTAPLSISVAGKQILVRKHLLTLVDVTSRATCATPSQRLRRYELQYPDHGEDPDTRLPRLRSVRMFGRQGTPEENSALPLAAYDYGTATTGGTLQYATHPVGVPAVVDHSEISGTSLDPTVNAPGAGDRYAMWQTLVDVDGDGRPDLVFKQNEKLWVAYNRPGPAGETTIGSGPQGLAQLTDATFASGSFATHTTAKRRYWYGTDGEANRNSTDVWRQAIDVNGDGRVDIIDAAEEPDHWTIYLNTPGPSGVKWEKRSWSVHNLALELQSRGHVLDGGYVPLARRTTGRSVDVVMCLKRAGANWIPYNGWFSLQTDTGTYQTACVNGHPSNPPPSSPSPPALYCMQDGMCAPPGGIEPERTYVEWELADLNGDGYPDFVFNSAPVEFEFMPLTNSSNPVRVGNSQSKFRLPASNQVRAAFNDVGVRFSVDEPNPFALSVSLLAPSPDFGVGTWEGTGADGIVQQQTAGLADINGDGLIDRVVNRKVYLGAYQPQYPGPVFFSPVFITLPGPLAVVRNTFKQQCAPGSTPDPPTSDESNGLRDLTGDGTPDYFAEPTNNDPVGTTTRVWIGTGAGFSPPVPVTGAFRFSHQTDSCDGRTSKTDGGLYDIDGDGRPEAIGLSGNTLTVSTLAGGQTPGRPEAGRLVRVDNGYGASSQITYVSAKAFTDNSVPFPEIVVNSVATNGALGLGGTLAGSRFAYGNAELVFDAAQDRYSFPGYRRVIEMRLTGDAGSRNEGAATILDSWPLTPFSLGLTKEDRWLRLKRVNLPRDIYLLRGTADANPWSFLNVYTSDPRVIGLTHFEYAAKLYEAPPDPVENVFDCADMVHPLDFDATVASSLGPSGLDVCRAHGFAFPLSTESWYGGAPPPSDDNVQTRTRVLKVDDFGRPLLTAYDNDVFRSDDDLCVENRFAVPIANAPRMLNAIGSRRIFLCGKDLTFASESFAYDGLANGSVSAGRVTSHTVDRRATDNGTLLHSVRVFDATYNAAGNLTVIRTQRGSATRTTTFAYDQFGLVPTSATLSATGVPTRHAILEYDPVSLEAVRATDEHQVTRGTGFDGFGRPVRSTMGLPGETLGVVGTTSYLGFAQADIVQERRVTSVRFPDPVPPANIGTAAGGTETMFLDELGRERRTEVALGADYANEVLVVRARAYDAAGRVAFEADPYPKSQDPMGAYGTSYYFKNTGAPDCNVRGRGRQPLTSATDLASERFPTCFQLSYSDHRATLDVRDAASLQIASPQAGVIRRVVTSAIGRVLERSTLQAANRLELATLGYNQLGQQTSITRYLDPIIPSKSVSSSWQLDSWGQLLQLNEPETATRVTSYSDWGEPTETRWVDGTIDRRITRKYDSLGRLVASYEQSDGVADPETARTYTYDVAVNLSPLVAPTFTLGRLARASAPSGDTVFSYDALGRRNAQVFTDPQAGVYIQKSEYRADGRQATLEFDLPDQNYAGEVVKYGYDSAGRLRTANYADTSGSRPIYKAEEIDAFGRVLKARYGDGTVLHAVYAANGRRLITEATVESTVGSRRLMFDRFDPMGRELSRRELSDGAATGAKTNESYDALGRLAYVAQFDGPIPLSNWAFRYDALGNILEMNDTLGSAGSVLSYRDVDRDRLCHIDYGGSVSGPACNVDHDILGRVVGEPTRTGVRQFSYFSAGDVRTITEQGTTAHFRYGPFGSVQELEIHGGTLDQRHEHRYGELIERRDAVAGGALVPFVTRRIPGLGGILASRHGGSGDWVFEFGELRGNRFFTSQDGTFVQRVDYQPYGEARSFGATPKETNYTAYQWNARDALAAFHLSQLGLRLYDPTIGRFLSRDPVLLAGATATSSPYTFAMDDPLNAADPSGLECHAEAGQNCAPEVLIGPWLPPGSVFANAGDQSVAPRVEAPRAPDLPQTEAGQVLWNESLIRNGTVPRGFKWDALARSPASMADKLDSIAENGKDFQEIDAVNAELDRARENFRAAGIGMAGGALTIAGGFLLAPEVIGVGGSVGGAAATSGGGTAAVTAGGGTAAAEVYAVPAGLASAEVTAGTPVLAVTSTIEVSPLVGEALRSMIRANLVRVGMGFAAEQSVMMMAEEWQAWLRYWGGHVPHAPWFWLPVN